MKWKKLGKIFDPTEHTLSNNCQEFAQSPQALVFEDSVRIYFSTRERDQAGMFISHISFAEFDKSFKKILNLSRHTVIPPGELGTYDEHGIFPLNILRVSDKVFGYIGGWSRRVSVSVETSIGLAISDDNGLTFKRQFNGPVLTSSLHEPILVGDPFVVRFGDIYHMWYIFGDRWIHHFSESHPQRVYKIGHAISTDGINWEKEGRQIIDDKLNIDECQALPSVIKHNGIYHMVFCYREAIGFRNDKNCGYKLGYASSDNLINWNRDDDKVRMEFSEGEWDSDMQCYPHFFNCNNLLYLLYNGNQFGRFGFGLAVLHEDL